MRTTARAHPARATHKRRGTYTLQVLVVVSISAVLLGLVTMAVHQLLKGHEQLRDTARNGLSQQRLSALFRRDSRGATTATIQDDTLRFTMPDARTVTYETRDNVVLRSWADSESKGSDRFYSTRDWKCQIELKGSRARLVIEQTAGGSKRTVKGRARKVVVESIVGRHKALADSLGTDSKDAAGDKQ